MSVRRSTLALPLVLVASAASAQVTGSRMEGTVKDASGAVIPAATVTVTNTDTGVVRTLPTNGAGFYSVPNLQPGPYQVMATAAGFSSQTVEGLTLTVGAQVVTDLVLRAGSSAEQVEVTSPQSDLDLASPTLSSVVDARTIRQLPLNGRDWTQLATLEPGVDLVRTQPTLAINNTRENRGLGNSLTISGARPQQNNYRLDGISINDFANGAPGSVSGSVLGVDAIQEFSVIINNAPVDYGKEAGGIINAVTRSGTNRFHGSAYEFIRNSVLDARNPFDGPTIPSFKKNQFGASAGLPLRRDKTFVFANYEGLRQGVGLTLTNAVPTADARAGRLTTGTVVVDPQVAPYLNLYPLPNGTISGNTGNNTVVTKQITNENFFTAKGDQNFSPHDALSLTYVYNAAQSQGPDSLNTSILGAQSRRQIGTVAETHTFSPSLVNSVHAGYSRIVAEAPQPLSAINPLAADTTLGAYPGTTAPSITVSGLALFQGGLGANANWRYHYNSYQLYDDAFLTRGTHTLKFGVALERVQSNMIGGGSPFGIFTFGSLSDFLQNKPASFRGPLAAPQNILSLRQVIAGGYAEDDWRARPNLTLTLGLRYEMATVPREAHDRLSSIVAFGSNANRVGNPLFQNPTYRNFEPRVGFAWDPYRNGKTSVRGAAGLYDVLPLGYLFNIAELQSAPFFKQGSVTQNSANALPQGTFPKGAPARLSDQNLRYSFVENNPKRNYVMQWNLNVQRQLRDDLSLTIAYSGSRGVHQPFHGEDINTRQPTLTPAGYVFNSGSPLLIPNAGQVSGVFWNGSTVYHALNVKLFKSLNHGLQFQAAYSWAKSIDTSSASIAGDAFTNSIFNIPLFNPRLFRALSDYDVRHTFSATYTWQLPPVPRALHIAAPVLNGWQWNSLFQAASGLPFSVGIGGNPLGLGSAVPYAFPDRLRGAGCDRVINPGSRNYLKTQCFAFPMPATRLGNAGRNSITGPGLLSLDTSLYRNIPVKRVSDQFNIQFRAECYNCINHTNLASPAPRGNRDIFNESGAVLTTTAGVITNTSTTSRQMQFGLKVTW